MNTRRLSALLLVFAPWLVSAQESATTGRLEGRVLSSLGRPIAGARVALEPPASAQSVPETVAASAEGRWSADLTPGVWRLVVEAEGYKAARGKVDVLAGPNQQLEVVLENDPDLAVKDWLRQGNILLDAGKPAAAQAFYEQAITVVFGPQVASIHKALARAYFMQDKIDDAVKSLQTAMLSDPTDLESRRLVKAVLSGAGRQAEADEWLETLDREGLAAAARQAFAVEVADLELADRPTGRFRTTIDSSSPFSGTDRLLARIGSYEVLGVEPGSTWGPEEESFEVFVPEGGPAEEPYGLFVWVSPTARGSLTDKEMVEVLEEERVIWIGANQSGNPRPRADRIRLALDAAAAVAKAYPVDPERVYVGGYSGGGRISSALTLHYPEVFRGGIYFMGVSFYRDVGVPDQPGKLWGATLQPPTEEALVLIRERSRFVFITGTYDFNRAQSHTYMNEYRRDGMSRVEEILIPDVGHYYGFRAPELRRALESLDAAGGL